MTRTPKTQKANRSFNLSQLEEETSWDDVVAKFRPITKDEAVDFVGSRDRVDEMDKYFKILLSGLVNHPVNLLVSGPSQSGKTTIFKKLIYNHKDELSFFHLDCSWIQEKKFGDPIDKFNLLCDQAISKQPSVIFIEKIEVANANIIIRFLNSLRNSIAKVLIIAETRSPESLNPQLLESNNFGLEIKVSMPTPEDRLEYIKHYLSSMSHSLDDDAIDELVTLTHCYSYGDLDLIRQKATYSKILDMDKKLTIKSFKDALEGYKPNLIKNTKPLLKLTWDQIGGVEDAKRELKQCVIEPLKYREEYTKMGVSKIKGALIYGPPGCSKTMQARALAAESGYQFIYIAGPELNSKYVGESEAEVRRIYREARERAPCIIFIDEIDGLAPIRGDEQNSVGSRIVTTLLLELDGARTTGDVFTIGATNRPHSLDNALLRPGRLESHIYIPLPSEKDRKSIFRIYMAPMPVKFDEPREDVIKKLASLTDGYSGAEIAAVCNKAGAKAISEASVEIQWVHFECALKIIRPRTNLEELKSYQKFQETYSKRSKCKAKKKSSLTKILSKFKLN